MQKTLLLLLFLMAFLPRALGADVGYLFGDERINDAAKVLTGQLVPGQHFYPPLLNYLNAIVFVGLFALGVPLGWWDNLSGFRAQYFSDPTIFFVTARMLVATLGAMLAPIAYLIARRFGLTIVSSVATGLIAAFFPLAVFLSHFAKGDVPLGTATALCFLVVAQRVSFPQSGKSLAQDAVVGLSFALTLSFKQSAVFGLLPLSIGMLVLLSKRQGFNIAITSYLRAFAIFVPIWIVLNIGIVLDFKRFLVFQGIQSEMSLGEQSGIWQGVAKMLNTMMDPQYGIGWVLGLAAAIGVLAIKSHACKITDKPLWIALWLSSVIGAVSVSALTGTRQPAHLFVAQFGELLILGTVLLAGFFQSDNRNTSIAAKIAVASTLVIFVFFMIPPVAQAMRPALTDKVDNFLSTEFSNARIVTMMRTRAKQSPEARDWEDERLARLAAKYNVTLPDVAPESRASKTRPGAQFWVPLPQAMYGLEDVAEGEESYEVQAHTWPLQPEEWTLEFWQRQGFSVFVLTDVAFHLQQRPSEVVSQFFEEIASNCAISKTFTPVKPMYLEYLTNVYVCPKAEV